MFRSPLAITWNVEGVGSGRYAWDLLLRYRESPTLLVIHQGLNQVFYFFPNYFADPSHWNDFRRIVASKLPRK